MWPPWLSVNITHCSEWSVFVVCDGDNYCFMCRCCCCCCCCWRAPPWQWGKPARCSVWSDWGSWSRGWRSPRRQGRPPIIILFNKILSVLLWNSHPSSLLDQLHQRQWEEFPCKLLRRKLHFQGRFFLFSDPQFQLIHPTDILRCYIHPRWCFLDSSGFCLLYYSFVCDVWELEMWYCGGEFKWIYMSSMSECCTIQYFDAFYKS